MKVFTVTSGKVEVGTKMSTVNIAGKAYPVIAVGEEGRGRKLAYLIIKNAPMICCPDRGGKEEWETPPQSYHTYVPGAKAPTCPKCGAEAVPGLSATDIVFRKKEPSIWVHPSDRGEVPGVLFNARVCKNASGGFFLDAAGEDARDDAIVVMPTPIGYRGGNSHTGYLTGEKHTLLYCNFREAHPEYSGREFTTQEKEALCEMDGGPQAEDFKKELSFHEFPGQILAEGQIAEGAAGRAGSGTQLIAIIPPGAIWRTGYTGRLYGEPTEHYYRYDGMDIQAMTWYERQATGEW